jgi:hypothetical protein
VDFKAKRLRFAAGSTARALDIELERALAGRSVKPALWMPCVLEAVERRKLARKSKKLAH